MRPFYFALLTILALSPLALAVPPVVEDPLQEGGEPTVKPQIPTGKALLFPVSAYSTEGEQLTITAVSSKPTTLVRVKTGNPLMRFDIQHSGSGADAPYTDTAIFQLFRDMAPETVGYMGGFAQAGFFAQPETLNSSGAATTGNDRIFRLADFGAVEGQPQNSFIFQGGSPTGTNTGNVGFTFNNEFHPGAIFAGNGQLAMANAGYNSLQRGTNGSQFFITEGNVRSLDFKHTIWGQLTHGFKVLSDLRQTPRQTTATTGTDTGLPDYPRQDQPNSPVRIISSSVVQQYVKDGRTYTDAVLVLSATAPGAADITFTARNAAGEETQRTFTVTAVDEPLARNSRPFLTQLPSTVIPANGRADLGFSVIDLERDYVTLSQALVSNGASTNPFGGSGFVRSNVLAVLGNPNYYASGGVAASRYTGPLYPTISATQYNMTGEGRAVDNATSAVVGVGDKDIKDVSVVIYGAPGAALPTVPVPTSSTTTAQQTVVGRYRDLDARAQATDVAVQINWGDGSALQDGTLSPDAVQPSATGFQITGTHTYARAGIYTIVTQLIGTKGLYQKLKSTAVISSNPVKAAGETLVTPGPTIANGLLATFVDTDAPGSPSAYLATVDWGDGALTPGTIKSAGVGKYKVLGKHTYRDSQRYAVSVRVHKAGAPAEQDALAWATVATTKAFGKRYLPPFDQAHLIAGITTVPTDHTVSDSAAKVTKQTVVVGSSGTASPATQTYFTYSLLIVNVGNLPSKPGKLRFYLSQDRTLNLQDEKDSAGVITNPKDVPMKMKDIKGYDFLMQGVQPGASLQYFFEKSQYADYRLTPPVNETGTGLYVLIQLDYSDPIADHEPIEKVAVEGTIKGILVEPRILQTRESGTSSTFKVRLDKQPSKDVIIPLSLDSTGLLEGTLDKASLTFTSANWNVAQVVTVTGKSDTPTSGTTYGRDGTQTYQVLLGAATGDDPLYKGMDGPDVTVSNADRDSNISISPTSLVTTEAADLQNEKLVMLTLQREPKSPVTITATVSKEKEALIFNGTPSMDDPAKRLFTFLPRNPEATPPIELTKSLVVRGKDDQVRDGNTTYTINFTVASDDKEFDGLLLPPVTVTSVDNGL